MKKLLLLLTFFNNCQFLQSSQDKLSIEELAATLNENGTDFLLTPEFGKALANTSTKDSKKKEPVRRSIRPSKKPLFFYEQITTDPRSSREKRRCTNPPKQLGDVVKEEQEEIEEKEKTTRELQNTEYSEGSEYTEKNDNTSNNQVLNCPIADCKIKINLVNTTILFHFILNHGKNEDNTCPLKDCNYILNTNRGADALRAHICRNHSKDNESCQINFLGFCKTCQSLIPQIHKKASTARLLCHQNHDLQLVLKKGPFNPEKIKKGRIALINPQRIKNGRITSINPQGIRKSRRIATKA